MKIQTSYQEIHPSMRLRLTPCLLVALRELAKREGLALPTLVTVLLLEALQARCGRRP